MKNLSLSRGHLPGILAMAAIVVASNILVQHLFGQWLTWGAFTYPAAFLITDLATANLAHPRLDWWLQPVLYWP